MIYTVGEMAQKLGVPASTLRYYDKEGLLPFVERSSGGIRMFRESDFEWLQVICCMKKPECPSRISGSILSFPCRETTPLTPGWKCFRHQREVLTQQIQQLQHTLETVEYKCWFYETGQSRWTGGCPQCDDRCGCAGAVPCHPAGASGTEDAEYRKIRNAVPVAFGTAFFLNLLTHGSRLRFQIFLRVTV